MESPANQLTELLQSWSQGDDGAIEKLMPLVYDDRHRLAQRYMADERPGHTLQTTALVNEAYLRLVDSRQANWVGRAHFFAVCARVMRRILVDWASSRHALKRGSDVPPLELQAVLVAAPGTDLVAIDDALTTLATVDPRKSAGRAALRKLGQTGEGSRVAGKAASEMRSRKGIRLQ